MNDSSYAAAAHKVLGRRPTIALFSERYLTNESYFYLQWYGASDRAKELDVNLLSVIGGGIADPVHGQLHEFSRNRLYNLITPGNVDGIIFGGATACNLTTEEIREFFARYKPLPLVSIAETLPETPSILTENSTGMRELFKHLIEDHGYRRIAFIRGPGDFGDAFVRFQVYREVLLEYGLPFDPDLVMPGNYNSTSGVSAVCTLLDEKKKKAGSIDAIVAANDFMALGAMEELQRRGIRVPGDIAVTGYDYTELAKLAVPSLTTVYQPISDQGKCAVDMLLAMIGGEKRPPNVKLPTKMVINESCGCGLPALKQHKHHKENQPGLIFNSPSPDSASLSELLTSLGPAAISGMARVIIEDYGKVGVTPEKAELWMTMLFDAFTLDLLEKAKHSSVSLAEENFPGPKNGQDKLPEFLSVLTKLLNQRQHEGDYAVLWNDIVSTMRNHLLPALKEFSCLEYAETLWEQARLILTQAIRRMEVARRFSVSSANFFLFHLGENLSLTFDSKRIIELLAEHLDDLHIPSCYLAVYSDSDYDAGMCSLQLAYSEGEKLDIGENSRFYPSNLILPEGFWPDYQFHLIVESLHFLEKPIGFMLLEAGNRNGDVYESLRSQISNALQGSNLVQQVSERARALQAANEEIRKLNAELKDENLTMRAEMDLARRIQTALLPQNIKSIHRDFDISAVMIPAEEVGGDYYDIILDKENRLWVGIGDVSGHGLTPGLIMMMAHTVHTCLTSNMEASARDMIIMINKSLYKSVQLRLHEEHFMTFTTLKYLGDGRFQFAGAHMDLIIYRKSTKKCEQIETSGLFLNFKANIDSVTENYEFTLKTGDILFLYTDGLTEARNEKKKLLDIKGLSESIIKHAHKSADEMKDLIMEDVLAWSNGKQDDDMSLVVIRKIL